MHNFHPKILVIIVLYNGTKWLEQCCDSLKASTVPLIPYFVDNCSTDDSVAIVKRHFPMADVIHCSHNLGFGQANNIGMRYALEHNFDYIFLLNQDAYIAPDMIEVLLEAMPEMEKPGIISPIHLNGDGSQIDLLFRNCLHYTVCPGCLDDFVRQNVKRCYQASMGYAAAWLLPITTIRNIGGFDPIFFHYGEDVHYVSRVLYHGLKIYNVPGAFVRHDREFAGNIEAYNHNIVFRGFKNSYLDLNRSGSWLLSRRQFAPLRDFVAALLTLNLSKSWEILCAYWKIFINRKVFQENIHQNRQTGTLWL